LKSSQHTDEVLSAAGAWYPFGTFVELMRTNSRHRL